MFEKRTNNMLFGFPLLASGAGRGHERARGPCRATLQWGPWGEKGMKFTKYRVTFHFVHGVMSCSLPEFQIHSVSASVSDAT